MNNWQDIKELEAVRALIKHEIADDYGCWFEVSRIVDSEFEVSFDKFCRFKGLTIRVIEVNEQKPEFSQFSVRVDDDYWEAFTAVDWTIKELWKALLWR